MDSKSNYRNKGNSETKEIEIGSRMPHSNSGDITQKREIPTARDRIIRTTKSPGGKPGGNDH